MGMFDRVWASCPKCNTSIELQSKAGRCVLADFTSDLVPARIAADLKGEKAWCEKCKVCYVVRTEPIKRVRVFLVPDTGDDDDDYENKSED